MRNRIKMIRKAEKLNQTAFAAKLGMAQTSYSQIERGERPILDRHIKAICSIFKVNEEWIRTGEGRMYSYTPDEEEILRIMERLPEQKQHLVIEFVKKLLEAQDGISK